MFVLSMRKGTELMEPELFNIMENAQKRMKSNYESNLKMLKGDDVAIGNHYIEDKGAVIEVGDENCEWVIDECYEQD